MSYSKEVGSGGDIIEDGVKMFHKKIGNSVPFKFSSHTDKRAQWIADLPKCFINLEVTFWLQIDKIDKDSEEVSIKTRGGHHGGNDDSTGSCYISGLKYEGGGVNAQFEKPHPKNHPLPPHEKPGLFNPGDVKGKMIGYKNIVYQEGDHDKIEMYLSTDALGTDGRPVNGGNFRKFGEWTCKEFFGKCNGKGKENVYIRCDDIPDGDKEKNVTMKFASVREIVPPV